MYKLIQVIKTILEFITRLDLSEPRKECTLREVNEHIQLIRSLKQDEIKKLREEIKIELKKESQNGSNAR